MSIQRPRSANCKCCKHLAVSLMTLLIHASSSFVNSYCVEVFQYAAKHGYRDLMDDAGLIAVQKKYSTRQIHFFLCNRPDMHSAWCRYSEHWLGLFDDSYNEPPPVLHPGGMEDCGKWGKFRNAVVSQVKSEVARFSSFEGIVEGENHYVKDCRHCCIRANIWTGTVCRYSRDMPKFTSFL